MAVNCCFCNSPTAKPVLCDKCNHFSCDKCTITRNNQTFCVKCYLEGCSESDRKRITDILKKSGVIKVDMAAELSFKGVPMTELSRIKSTNGEKYTVKCKSKAGAQYFEPTSEQFSDLWSKTLKFGYKPERIPFGERIVIPAQIAQNLSTKKL